MKMGFTLLELIIVIVIIGILATLGYSQYTIVVEKARSAEPIAVYSQIVKSVSEYYLKNGDASTMTSSDLNLGSGTNNIPNACRSTHYFSYAINCTAPSCTTYGIGVAAYRCTSGGKEPQGVGYAYRWLIDPVTGIVRQCFWSGGSWHTSNGDDCVGR